MNSANAFVYFSKPGSSDFNHISCPAGLANKVQKLSDISGESGYVFAPFDKDAHPLFFFPGVAELCADVSILLPDLPEDKISTEDNFIAYIQEIKGNIQTQSLMKCVAARSEFISSPIPLDLHIILKKCRKYYPHTWISLVYHPDIGLWLTASPELLTRIYSSVAETVALAGTRTADQQWTEKELVEQDFVTKYLREQFEAEPEISPLEEVQIGPLFHLQRRIRWTMNQPTTVFPEKLHPTPALCGTPSEKAKALIRTHEGNSREYFGGYQGYMDPIESSYFVSIRCAKISKNGIRFFAGAGITKDSVPEDELKETEKKMNILKSVVLSYDQ